MKLDKKMFMIGSHSLQPTIIQVKSSSLVSLPKSSPKRMKKLWKLTKIFMIGSNWLQPSELVPNCKLKIWMKEAWH